MAKEIKKIEKIVPVKKPKSKKAKIAEDIIGSVRLRAFKLVEEIISNPNNRKKLKEDMQEKFNEDPTAFYKQFVHPVAIKEVQIIPGDGNEAATISMLFGDGSEEEI